MRIFLAALSLSLAALSFAEESQARKQPEKVVFVLSNFGDVSTKSEAQKTLEKLVKAVKQLGGGTIVIDNKVCEDFIPVNNFQKNLDNAKFITPGYKDGYAGSKKNYPTATILDARNGYIGLYLPQYGGRSSLGRYGNTFSGLSFNRTFNIEGKGLDPAGLFSIVDINSNIVRGTVNFMQRITEPVQAGKDVKLYFTHVIGLWEGAQLTSPRIDGKGEIIQVKKILWDKEKKKNYIIADLERSYKRGTLFTNKSNVPGLSVMVNSNADNQTAGHIGVYCEKNGMGDEFLFSGMLSYSSDISNAGGDEGGVVYNAEVRQNLESFRSVVRKLDREKNILYFEPGPQRTICYNLSTSRPIINLNSRKWITKGDVRIVADRPAIKNPFSNVKYSYKGKTYPCYNPKDPLFRGSSWERGGLIEGSKDAPWDESVVGRYFAIDEPSEYILGKKDFYTGYHYGPPNVPVRRWYQIVSFEKNDDGTKKIKIKRLFRCYPASGSPVLIDENNYTWDGHIKPLKYIIAPGAQVCDIGKAWQNSRNYYKKEAHISKDSPFNKLKIMPNGDNGTKFDFEPGDKIVQAVGPEPWTPRPIRIRTFNHFPSDLDSYSIEVVNYNTIATTNGISFNGRPGNKKQMEKRKDKNPAYINGVYFHEHSSVGSGIRFAGYVRDAAMLMDQKDNEPQPIVWRHNNMRKKSSIVVNPKNGNFEISSNNVDVKNTALIDLKGLSGTDKASSNLRGINVTISNGSSEAIIKFSSKELDNIYLVNVQPNWNTSDWISEKRADGFTVKFSNPAPENAKIDWLIIR